ncbi:MAG: FecR domain-containing protein [Fidelibacterota bacterium]
MIRQWTAVSLIIISLISIGSAQKGKRFGKITLPLGRVEVRAAGSEQWKKAGVNQTVFVNDALRTRAKSRAEITLTGGGKLRIGENSELELLQADIMGMQKDFNAQLKSGNVWVSAKAGFGERKNVAVRTPTAVAAIRGTKYRAVADKEESSVLVYQGEVEVNRPENLQKMRRDAQDEQQKQGGPPKFRLGPVQEVEAPTQIAGPYEVSLEDWIKLVEGMQINVRADGKYHLFEFDKEADAQSEWVQWNQNLDGD